MGSGSGMIAQTIQLALAPVFVLVAIGNIMNILSTRLGGGYVRSVSSTRSELAIPLTVGGKVVGVLDCQSDKEDFLSPETIDLLKVFSTQASIAIQNARLRQSEQRRGGQSRWVNRRARGLHEPK